MRSESAAVASLVAARVLSSRSLSSNGKSAAAGGVMLGFMYEEPADIEWLQHLLTTSLTSASEHLRSIIRPGRTASAAELAARLTGMRTLALSTVSAAGRPRISGVDGHFLRARWVFTTSGGSVKAADMRMRPAVSAAYLEGDTFGVFTHGDAEFLAADHPDRGWIEDHLTRHYGSSPSTWGPDIVYLRINPRWMVGYDGAGIGDSAD